MNDNLHWIYHDSLMILFFINALKYGTERTDKPSLQIIDSIDQDAG